MSPNALRYAPVPKVGLPPFTLDDPVSLWMSRVVTLANRRGKDLPYDLAQRSEYLKHLRAEVLEALHLKEEELNSLLIEYRTVDGPGRVRRRVRELLGL